jgi:hypothetical protein
MQVVTGHDRRRRVAKAGVNRDARLSIRGGVGGRSRGWFGRCGRAARSSADQREHHQRTTHCNTKVQDAIRKPHTEYTTHLSKGVKCNLRVLS